MKRSSIAIAAAALILVGGGIILYVLVSGRLGRPSAPETPPTAGTEGEGAPADEVARAALDVYFLGPDAGADRAQRVELTLLSATLKRKDGKEFPVYAGRTTVVVQQDAAEKLFAELIPAGDYGELVLTFQAAALIVAPDGSAAPAFLPQSEVTLRLTETLVPGRSMAVLARFGFTDAFGVQNSVPTFRLPAAVDAESVTFGGIFASKKSYGSILSPSAKTLAALIKADTGMNITPDDPQAGTHDYVPPGIPSPQR
jgi:hypothetical protein